MPDHSSFSDEELNRYFNDPDARRAADASSAGAARPTSGVRGFFHRHLANPKRAQAAFALSVIVGFVLVCGLLLSLYLLTLTDDLPSLKQIENPDFQFATIAYTADGEVLARYALQNRSWVTLDEISPHVAHALLATEDRRFYDHWGVDTKGILAAIFDLFTEFDLRGASTISQQLARNLYNEQIGFDVSIGRKLKEAITTIELERRYTKKEIIEMYLNTVPFAYTAWGVEAAAHTFYGKSADELDPLEAATMIGMLKATTYYNPVRNPENAKERRNVVLWQMVKVGYVSEEFYDAHHDDAVETDYHSTQLSASLAPYFAEYVRQWMEGWARENGYNFYGGGLRVYTTLNSKLQQLAHTAVERQMTALQAVVDYEWSRPSSYYLGSNTEAYLKQRGEFEPFDYFWTSKRQLVNKFIRESERYRRFRAQEGIGREEAVAQLRANGRFMDSLRTKKTTLQVGLVSIDPRTGFVKAWVGGRGFEEDKYGHVALAERQPGSTFKPFVYTAAIDNGYSPYTTLRDSAFAYRLETGQIWRPSNFGGSSGQMLTLTQGLARSKNTITARVMMKLVNPEQVAFYARRMGIRESKLREVPALALGTSEVTLLEMTAGYSTLGNGGLYYPPTVVTRIEDRNGNVLYEYLPAPEEALSEQTAYTVVDMMRGVIDYGTGIRIRTQWGLDEYDLAGKTGTTQENADAWFMLMHPELVTGAWVGFNDRRIHFRSSFWGQGAHTALFVVGDYFSHVVQADSIEINDMQFPLPDYGSTPIRRVKEFGKNNEDEKGRVGW